MTVFKDLNIYTDDGWSGASFDRPNWKRLIEDVEQGKIDPVIVKDMSRAGRDYLRNESRQHNRQQNKAKRREKEI